MGYVVTEDLETANRIYGWMVKKAKENMKGSNPDCPHYRGIYGVRAIVVLKYLQTYYGSKPDCLQQIKDWIAEWEAEWTATPDEMETWIEDTLMVQIVAGYFDASYIWDAKKQMHQIVVWRDD